LLKINELTGKRIGSLDYGKKRTGFAVCDEFHITVTPKEVFDSSDRKFFDKLINIFQKERIEALVVGIPIREDENNKEFLDELNNFIEVIKQKSGLSVFTTDESFSSKSAIRTMLDIGYRKKKRAEKGNTDKIAAAIILRDFLNELSSL
jgi:putative holliday junction resolvase